MESRLVKYNIEAGNSYNMDEKSFTLGVIHKSKRVFSRHQYEYGERKQIIQDGNHGWVTVMACVCADGIAISPGLIYQSSSGNIQDSWVRSTAKHDDVYVACSNSVCSNNNLALAWLQDVFVPATKAKASRSWRLLIADGHGSHVTMIFIDYCIRNRIILAIRTSQHPYVAATRCGDVQPFRSRVLQRCQYPHIQVEEPRLNAQR